MWETKCFCVVATARFQIIILARAGNYVAVKLFISIIFKTTKKHRKTAVGINLFSSLQPNTTFLFMSSQ